MFPVIKNISSREQYAGLLKLFYGYYKPLQDGIDEKLDTSLLVDYEQRRRPGWILDDLETIGEPSASIAICQNLPGIDSNAAAFGALYVMEGSSLGGKVICKTISENLGLAGVRGLKFFNSYGPETGSRWKTFLAALHSFDGKPEEPEIIETANSTFLRFYDWLDSAQRSA